MIAVAFTLLLVVSSTVAFSGFATRSRSMTMMAEKSKALPFLARPEKVLLLSHYPKVAQLKSNVSTLLHFSRLSTSA
jgi:hypothetical protein